MAPADLGEKAGAPDGGSQRQGDAEPHRGQARRVGKALDQGIQGDALRLEIAVVPGQLKGGPPGEGMLGRGGGQALLHPSRFVAPVRVEVRLEGVELVVEGGIREIEPVELVGPVGGEDHRTARAAPRVLHEEAIGRELHEKGLGRTPDEQRPAPLVVADDRLMMGARGPDRGHGKRDAPVQQLAGDLPGHPELADHPPVRRDPGPEPMVGGAVVADLVRHRGLIEGTLPERGERGEGGRRTGLVMLLDKGTRSTTRRRSLPPRANLSATPRWKGSPARIACVRAPSRSPSP